MHEVSNLRSTIVPKSDQLNAEQLLGGDLTITVTDVRVGSSDEQPIIVHYEGEAGRPYKPCKTMRKVLIFAWGEDGRQWVGKSMTLFNDEAVKYGGMSVGGIRISHLSDIERDINVSLTLTKGKKAQHTIQVLRGITLERVLAAIDAATNRASMAAARALAEKLTNATAIQRAREAYAARVAALKAPAKTENTTPARTLNEYTDDIDGATSAETAGLVLDEARGVLSAEDYAELQRLYDLAWKV